MKCRGPLKEGVDLDEAVDEADDRPASAEEEGGGINEI